MKKLKFFIICTAIVILSFSAIAYAETNSVYCGSALYTYDNNGNITIDGSALKYDYECFLEYVGDNYSVTSINLTQQAYVIENEAFSQSSNTLKEITIPLNVCEIGYNIFGEEHNVKIKYDGSEQAWSEIVKQDSDEYYGNIEFYSSGYASLSGVSAEAYQNKVLGSLNFDFVEKDCVAEFNIYTYNNDGEKELNNTYTLNIPADTDSINYSFDFVSDGKMHLLSVVLYDDLTNKTQWGNVCEREFLAYDNSCICEYISVESHNSKLRLYMDFMLVEKDCVAFVEIFDCDENDNLSLNKEFIIEIPANTEITDCNIPFVFDNKSHLLKVSFYDNMTSKNELFDSMTSDYFWTTREYNGFLYDFVNENTVKITGYQNYLAYDISLPVKIAGYTVTEIAENAFEGHSEFETIIIPDNYKKIGEGAFSGCNNLTMVKYIGTQNEWENISISENNEKLTSAKIAYNYTPEILAYWDYQYDGETFIASLLVDNCYNDCLAKIELVNLSKNEATTLYYDLEKDVSIQKEISIPLSNYDETFKVYGSIVSMDKTDIYTKSVCFAFFTPYAEEEILKENDFEYCVSKNDEAEIIRYYGSDTSLIVPDTLGGYPVVKLRGWSLSGLDITNLTVGKNLREIGYGALSYCFSLESITVNPENEYFKFENGVLYNADKTKLLLYLLTNLETHFEIPDSVTVIGAHAFEAVENLKTITISENVERIERQAFAYSEISGELILPEGLKTIGSEALSCKFLKIYMPKSVSLIARDAISGSMGLTEITVDEENEKYTSVDGVLFNKSKTQLIKYPEEKAMQSYKIPDTITEINCYAFAGTTRLIKVVIPQSVKTINEGAFYFSSPKAIFYLGTEDEWADVISGDFNEILNYDVIIGESKVADDDNFRYQITPDRTVIIACLNSLTGYVSIPETINDIPVDTIGENSFIEQKGITTLYIPKNIKTFNVYYAFEGLDGLEKFVVDENNNVFTTDSDGVLYNKSKTQLIKYPASNPDYIEKYTIPQHVESILPFAFSGSSLKGIEINENVKTINRYAFVNMYGLENFVVNNNSKYTAVDGVLYTADEKTLIQYPCGRKDETFVVPDTVVNIAQDAFRNSWGLQTVILPLEIKNIGEYAFYDCENLTHITIPAGILDIKPYTFYKCIKLNKITFSDNVKSIGINAFGLCSLLNNVYFSGVEEKYDNINIHESNAFLTKEKVSFVTPVTEIISQSGNKVFFEVKYILNPARVLIVYYKDGAFEKLDERTYTPDKTEAFTLDSSFDYEKDTVKIMVWDSLSTLKPLCESIKIGK